MNQNENNGESDQKWVNKVRIANRYGVSTRTVQTWMKEGKQDRPGRRQSQAPDKMR
jgi:transposase